MFHPGACLYVTPAVLEVILNGFPMVMDPQMVKNVEINGYLS